MLQSMGWLCCFVFSIPTFAQADRLYEHLYRIENGQITGHGLFEAPSPRFAELEANKASFQAPGDVLDYIIAKQPRLKKNVVLVHNSESQQVSSLEYPRIILFSGGVAYGFSEHPSQKHQRIEMMEVEPTTYRISFNEIVFESKGPRFERKPKSCTTCHGDPGKPLWNPYDFWPHAFASNVGMSSTVEEEQAYTNLVARRSSSQLLPKVELYKRLELDSESNTSFNSFINQINLGRWINQEMPPGKSLNGFDATLLASTSGCFYDYKDKTDSDVEARVKTAFRSGESLQYSFAKVSEDAFAGRKHFNDYLDRKLEEFFPAPTYSRRIDHDRLNDDARFVAQQIWMLRLAGFNTSNLSTSLHGSDVVHNQPTNFSFDLGTALYELRPDLFTGMTVKGVSLGLSSESFIQVDCGQAIANSVLATRTASAVTMPKWNEYKNNQPVMSRCSKCHVDHQSDGGARAPDIPFDNPIKLADLLDDPVMQLRKKIKERLRTKDPARVMPPMHPLSSSEAEAFEAFLGNL